MNVTVSNRFIERPSVPKEERYHMVVGKSGDIWLYPDNDHPADEIHVSTKHHDGYCGRELHYHLVDGTAIMLHGPWHSNSDALYDDTGVDLRSKHITYVVIAKDRDYTKKYETIMKDVLYQDEKPMVGAFERGTRMAMEMAQKMGIVLMLYKESWGGSSCGPIYPDQIDVYGNRPKEEVA